MLWWHARVASLGSEVIETNRNREDQTPCVSPTRSAGALLCLPRSLPNPSPRRRSQRGARAAQRARTTLTPTSGDPRSATRKALAAHPRSTGPPSDPPESRRGTGTNYSPAAPAQNLCLRRRNPSSNPCGDPHSCRKTPFCVSCGRALVDGARFCSGCGRDLTLGEPEAAPLVQTVVLAAPTPTPGLSAIPTWSATPAAPPTASPPEQPGMWSTDLASAATRVTTNRRSVNARLLALIAEDAD